MSSKVRPAGTVESILNSLVLQVTKVRSAVISSYGTIIPV